VEATQRIEQQTIESLRAEIDRIVAERQELRRTEADALDLEENRTRLVRAQARLSGFLIQLHLHGSAAA
jgi:hypothetical protein